GTDGQSQRGAVRGRQFRLRAPAARQRCRPGRAPRRAVRVVRRFPWRVRPGGGQGPAAVGGGPRGAGRHRPPGRREATGRRRRGGRGSARRDRGIRARGDPAAARRLRARAPAPQRPQLTGPRPARTDPSTFPYPMARIPSIPRTRYARRRKQLMRMAGNDAILVLPAAPERVRSRDTHYPYRQDSDLLYLAGFPEPEAVLVLVPGRKHGESLLFCRERDPDREAWDGPRIGPEGAVESFGMDDAYPIEDIDEILPGLLEGRTRVYYHFGRDTDFDLKLIGWLNRVRAQVRRGAEPPHEFLELGHLLDEMRLFKSSDELKLMCKAAKVTVLAHQAAMRAARPGVHEYELQAEIERVFRANDGYPAYETIVGAGANGCVLHYIANAAKAKDGDLVLVDAGAEIGGYASDMCRTFPLNGRFTREQRALHDLVSAAHAAALAREHQGVPH